MSSARIATLKILYEQPNKEMKINLLGKQLNILRTLGFGVEVEDIISSLIKDGEVIYNRETDIVRSLNNEEQKRFHMVLEMKSCVAAANELYKIGISFGRYNSDDIGNDYKQIINTLRAKAKEIEDKLKQ